ncbi:MAG TPA: tRNA lysidine(34) synthetase TilS [Oleiagrimonas sp.]|nr:tRNA lysidine(34) synthetase TilS [Oleiagrimonas sp.]
MTDCSTTRVLERALAAWPDDTLCVGFSGGPDSSALLHALAALPQARARGLRAVHVDHGLSSDSQTWAQHCVAFCSRIDVPLEVRRVHVERQSGTGPEAAARDARYAAFADLLRPGESLLTAHHGDDQAETVVLKLLRGAGPEGLGGMRERRPFAGGWLWRPLLDTPREVLTDYLRVHAIECIHDPSNQSAHYARNFLRLDILPRLVEHWPRATQAINHSAALNRQTADFIRQCSNQALTALQHAKDNSLDAQGWLQLHPALRGPVLETWLHAQHLHAPSVDQREQLLRQVRDAAADRVPLVCWPGTAVHVWRGRLHAHPPLPDVPVNWKSSWHGEALQLPAAGGTLQLTATGASSNASVPTLEVRLGQTGVRLRPAGDRHTRELRDLYQQAGIPPWRRCRMPLIHDADGTLLAIADLWQTNAGKALFSSLKVRPKLSSNY